MTQMKSSSRYHGRVLLIVCFCCGLWSITEGFHQNIVSFRRTTQLSTDCRFQPCLRHNHEVTTEASTTGLFALDSHDNEQQQAVGGSRRHVLLSSLAAVATAALVWSPQNEALAAPPIFIIADELGYFPVRNRQGETSYIPRPVRRHSSEQAIALAEHLRKSGVVMYGAYWCPHCARQRELFGREAWSLVLYEECASKGYQANVKLCQSQQDIVTGFPTWTTSHSSSSKRRNSKAPPPVVISGEQSLGALAKEFQYPGPWNDELELNVPPPLNQAGGCKL